MELGAAFDLISRAIDTGRAAHGYLIVGDVRGNASDLVMRILRKLYPEDLAQVEAHGHPDVAWLEPQGRSRTIKVQRGKDDDGPGMRDGMIEPMSETAYSGGWKVGVVVGADRMQPEAANALLKSLEEPTPNTLYLLLTDMPEAILPTIVSRTQRVDLPQTEVELSGADAEAVADAFAAKDAAAMAAKLDELKESVDDADVANVRKQFYRTVMGFVRRLMLSGKLPWYQGFRNVDAVEDAYRQSSRSISDEAVISLMLDRIVFP